MAGQRLIGIDWGTTTLRAALIDGDGHVIARVASSDGLMALSGRGFEAVLTPIIAPFEAHGRLPLIASGMVTSRTGWNETPYLACPAGASELALRLTHHVTPEGRAVAFVPGLSHRHPDGAPDVMRGEETEVAGLGLESEGLVVLPGTHSKWVRVGDGQIQAFRTAMTGDVFAALRDHTILRLTTAEGVEAEDAFQAGVHAGFADGGAGLLGKLFRLRAGSLLGDHAPETTAERLSGLLIGAEIAESAPFTQGFAMPVTIVGSDDLTGRYRSAFRALGLTVETARRDAAFVGQAVIAKAAGIL